MAGRARDRIVVDRPVSCQRFSGDEQIVVCDLSTSGCMISKSRGGWATGETLLISLIGGTEIAGEIVWERETRAGVRFTSQLPERTVGFLGFKKSNGLPYAAADTTAE